MSKRQALEFEVQDLLGFIALLQDGRAAKLLAPLALNKSQFTVLFLLAQEPERAWTISELARHMEMQLPGISKIVTQLLQQRLLKSDNTVDDKRKKLIRITAAGIKRNEKLLAALGPSVAETFSNWSSAELNEFRHHLSKLRDWLDAHREP